MTERLRLEVIQLHLGGASQRSISKMLGISRKTVRRIITEHEAVRSGGGRHPDLPQQRRKRPSSLDPFESFMRETLERFPDITAVRMHEKLEDVGFTGKYTIVREKLKDLRPVKELEPVDRFETGKGLQAQMDYSTYTIDFAREGRRKVHLFSYILSYSRRQYLRFVEHQDFTTTIRQHIRAFEYMGGAAKVCLYDNMKVVVAGFDGDDPIYNSRFLAFAFHYSFRPWACRRRRSKTKGKVERPFDYVEKNLLNGRTFADLDELNRVAEWWLNAKANVRNHRTTGQPPNELWETERALLQPLPAHPYDTAIVIYRVVDVEGYVSYAANAYSVPWQFIGETLAVQVTEDELMVYGLDLAECAVHELFPASVKGEKRTNPAHRPQGRGRPTREMILERYRALGEVSYEFCGNLLDRRRYGKHEALRVLALLQQYRKEDLVKALERAYRYGSFGFESVERILGHQAEPRPALELLDEEVGQRLIEDLGPDCVEPRPTSHYDNLHTREVGPDGEATDLT